MNKYTDKILVYGFIALSAYGLFKLSTLEMDAVYPKNNQVIYYPMPYVISGDLILKIKASKGLEDKIDKN